MKEERKRILKMVEKGTITVEEALTLIEKLEAEYKEKKGTSDHTEGPKVTILSKKDDPFFEEDEKVTEDSKQQYTNSQSFQQAKHKLLDFVDLAVKKIKEIDLDLQWAKGIEISHIFQHTDAEISEVEFDIPYGALKLTPWDQKEVRIECQAKVYKVDNQDEARDVFLKSSVFSVKDGKLRFVSQPKILKVDAHAYIPKQEYDLIWAKLFNGSFKSESLQSKKTIIKSVNGSIQIEGIRGDHVDAESTNGKISLNNCYLENVEGESINGKLVASGEFKKVDLQCLNGSVNCDIHNLDVNTVRLKAGTGGINLALPKGIPAQGELKTNMGNVNVNLEADVHVEKSEVLQKQVTFQTEKTAEKKAYIFAESKTGSINISEVKARQEV